MASEFWLRVPDDLALCDAANWKKIGKNRYSSVREHFLIVPKKGNHTLAGPIIHEQELPAGSEIKYERKQVFVKKSTETITTYIQRTISHKLASEVSSKFSKEIGLAPVVSAKVSVDVQSKLSTEFSEALTQQLSGTKSFEVTSTEEFTSALTLKLPEKESASKVMFYIYLRLWPWTWDIYLYKRETLELTYKSSWLIWQVRETIKYAEEPFRVPLARVTFYEPDVPSVKQGSFEPEIADSSQFKVQSLIPLVGLGPTVKDEDGVSLPTLAEVAFPASKQERKDSDQVRSRSKKPPTKKEEFIRRIGAALPDKKLAKAKKAKAAKAAPTKRPMRAPSLKAGSMHAKKDSARRKRSIKAPKTRATRGRPGRHG